MGLPIGIEEAADFLHAVAALCGSLEECLCGRQSDIDLALGECIGRHCVVVGIQTCRGLDVSAGVRGASLVGLAQYTHRKLRSGVRVLQRLGGEFGKAGNSAVFPVVTGSRGDSAGAGALVAVAQGLCTFLAIGERPFWGLQIPSVIGGLVGGAPFVKAYELCASAALHVVSVDAQKQAIGLRDEGRVRPSA